MGTFMCFFLRNSIAWFMHFRAKPSGYCIHQMFAPVILSNCEVCIIKQETALM